MGLRPDQTIRDTPLQTRHIKPRSRPTVYLSEISPLTSLSYPSFTTTSKAVACPETAW